MSIISWNTDQTGQIGSTQQPRRVKIICTNTLAQVITAGFLNGIKAEGFAFYPTDIIDMFYLFNTATGAGTYGEFLVSIAGGTGLITLSQTANAPLPILPVVSGDLAVFSGTSGAVADSNILATNVMLKNAVNTMAAGSSIVLAKVNGTEAANVVTASGTAGVITTSALTTAAGATYVITWTNTFISSTSSISLQWEGGTNTIPELQFKVIPGAGSAVITIYNIGPTLALNGTLLLGYIVL